MKTQIINAVIFTRKKTSKGVNPYLSYINLQYVATYHSLVLGGKCKQLCSLSLFYE